MGRPCSEETKQKISFGHTGLILTPEQRYARRLEKNTDYRKRVRAKAFEKLGNRCVGTSCHWVNADGSTGCDDTRVLQIDHVNGGGYKERKNSNQTKVYVLVLEDTEGKYQLLCPTCNWIKRIEQEEGAEHTLEGRRRMSEARRKKT